MKPTRSLAVFANLPPISTSVLRSLGRRYGYLAVLLLPVLFLLSDLNAFPYPTLGDYSDLAITHFPNAFFLKTALTTWRSLPLWSPTILSGYPFFANPLSGLWYPPGWIGLLLPLPMGINLLVVLHLIWGGAGFYRLLRFEGINPQAALLGALAFEAMPKIFAHYGAGHVTLIYALCWTPWLLLMGVSRGESLPGDYPLQIRPNRWWGWSAVILALVFLADVRWVLYAGALWWGYVLWRRSGRFIAETGIQPVKLKVLLCHLAGLTILGVLLAAPLALPLAEYARLSTRNSLTAADVSAFSLPPARLLGLVYPDLGGFHEWVLYPGSVTLVLALLAFLWRRTRQRGMFWLWVALFALIFALGDSLPYFGAIAHMPGLDLLRVPARALFLAGMGLAALAAFSLDALQAGLGEADTRRARLLLVSLVGFVLLLPALGMALMSKIPMGFIWGALAVSVAAGWLVYGIHKRLLSHQLWLAGLLGLCLLELLGVDQTLYRTRSSAEVFTDARELTAYLAGKEGKFRVYSPSYSLPQENAARAGLELADGVDPLQLQTYADFMESASGVPFDGYSVTLPPFAEGNPATANAAFVPRADLLGLLNVRFVTAEYDLDADGLTFLARFWETRLYENRLALPRAWVQPSTSSLGENYSLVDDLTWSPNRIEIEARGPGLLVLSEIAYPGWSVWVDGRRQTLLNPGGILRGVELPSGAHRVVFLFRPISLYLGLSLSLLGGILLLGGVVVYRKRGSRC